MFCSKCGSQTNEGSKYCPSCGAKFESNESIGSDQPQQIIKKKPMPLWFIILVVTAILALIGVTAGILFTESLVDVVDNQLSDLRDSNIDKAYYAYTSSEFQKSTSLDEFREFVETYPVFVHNQSAHFTQRSLDHNLGTLKGNLTDLEHKKIPVEYKLIKEDGKWRILSIRLLKPEALKPSVNIQQLNVTVENQLKAIKQGNILEAYNNYSSKEFQEATNEEAFKDFVNRYPVLTHYDSIAFNKTVVRNGVGIVSIVLQNNVPAYAKYYLISENDTWKIWSMRILSPIEEESLPTENLETSTTTPMEFSNIVLGTKVDANGVLQDPSTALKTDSGNIYVNIAIINGAIGETIHLNFQHLESHSSILAKATIEENGDSMLVSVFSPPAKGWLKGNYSLTVTSSTALNKTIDFTIE